MVPIRVFSFFFFFFLVPPPTPLSLLILLGTASGVPHSLAQPETRAAFQSPPNSSHNHNRNNSNSNNNQSDKPAMKAWFCDGKTQRNLVEHLRQARIVQSTAVQRVMEAVDRRNYLPETSPSSSGRNPYADAPQPIPKGQTISAPHMHSYALEEMLPHLLRRQTDILASDNPHQAIRVLDVGCGSGYLTACFGRWFQPHDPDAAPFAVPGQVYGMDIHPELVDLTRHNLGRQDADLVSSASKEDSGSDDDDDGNDPVVRLRVGNGWKGWEEAAPFDAIHVGAAASSVPMDLVGQLRAPHGVLIVPVGAAHSVQRLLKIQRIADSSADGGFSIKDFTVEELLQVRYVPLVEGPDAA